MRRAGIAGDFLFFFSSLGDFYYYSPLSYSLFLLSKFREKEEEMLEGLKGEGGGGRLPSRRKVGAEASRMEGRRGMFHRKCKRRKK